MKQKVLPQSTAYFYAAFSMFMAMILSVIVLERRPIFGGIVAFAIALNNAFIYLMNGIGIGLVDLTNYLYSLQIWLVPLNLFILFIFFVTRGTQKRVAEIRWLKNQASLPSKPQQDIQSPEVIPPGSDLSKVTPIIFPEEVPDPNYRCRSCGTSDVKQHARYCTRSIYGSDEPWSSGMGTPD